MAEKRYKCYKCNESVFDKDEIATLTCKHSFCWLCIKEHIKSEFSPKIRCPALCSSFIPDRIIRKSLTNEEIVEYDKLSLGMAKEKEEKLYTCLLKECCNFYFIENDIQFECIICNLFNCTKCMATHPTMNCSDFQKYNSSSDLKVKKWMNQMQKDEMKRALEVYQNYKFIQADKEKEAVDKNNVIPNDEIFTCALCCKQVAKNNGVSLRKCFHLFCKTCLKNSIINNLIIPIRCPESDCDNKLEDREIAGVLDPLEWKKYLNKSSELVGYKLENGFHCKKPDCPYYVIIEGDVPFFICPICKSKNCVNCCVIHPPSENCAMYQIKQMDSDGINKETNEYLKREIESGKCMICPTCSSVIVKDGGCNWIRCSQCHLELCWVLKIPRWGPKGKGDISGGCKCGVDNKLCDPKCYTGCIPDN